METTFDYASLDIPTPSFVIDRARLRKNMRLLAEIQNRTGAKFLLALKGFASWGVFDDMIGTLHGITASSVYEARLGVEEFAGGEIHAYSPAFNQQDVEELSNLADHIVFNSFNQWQRFHSIVEKSGRNIQLGLRVNPEYSEVRTEIYNPCTNVSRFGIRRSHFNGHTLDGISGLHFHTMCQQGPGVLHRTLKHVEKLFGEYFHGLEWINFGGGHHVTREGYDVDMLCDIINDFRSRTGLEVYLEPGEAHVLNTGFMVTTVLDIIENPHSSNIAIVDTSASAHMPDILEMPYTPEMVGAEIIYETPADVPLDEFSNKYILGGKTCLSGDVIGEYGVDHALRVGDRLVLSDMAQYTIVKNTMFNGIQPPSIVTCDSEVPDGDVRILRRFNYADYKHRLS